LAEIKSVRALQILDSRGNPTVQVTISDGTINATASVPSGASTGSHEALELRDGGSAFGGKGVTKAVMNVNQRIYEAVKGMSVSVRDVDSKMLSLDGTPNKSSLGANAILGVSMAVARLEAASMGLELFEFFSKISGKKPSMPVPLLNIINGGVHAGGELKIQEFLIVPAGMKSFSEALRAAAEIYQVLKARLKERYGVSAVNLGDEGGFAPQMRSSSEALEEIGKAVEQAGYGFGKEVFAAIDAASTEFFKDGLYSIDGRKMRAEELSDYYASLLEKYKLISIEDPFYEDGFEEFAAFTKKYGKRVQIIGDDLYVTNRKRIERGIEIGATNAVLIKLNQIGTVSETLESIDTARRGKLRNIISHRSGETIDSFIADLAVGTGAGQIKTGAPARGERVAKYNRLLEIESMHSLNYKGMSAFSEIE
jgi:enolase